ncbi:MAG: DUF6503 family protein [Acidobacteriota bacterium]
MKARSALSLMLLSCLGIGACSSPPEGGDASPTPMSGEELLDAMIAFHDPQGLWATSRLALGLDESRPDGSVRKTSVFIDPLAGSTLIETQRDGRDVSMSVSDAEVTATVDGRQPTPEEAESLRLTPDQATRMRNYYVYLYGLPMKLRDPGTLIDSEVRRTEVEGREALVLRVTYDPEVGGDTWLFYADPETFEMFRYQFFHDESAGDGEYIVLEGLAEVGGLKLPAARTWFTNQGDELLGTDTIRETSTL